MHNVFTTEIVLAGCNVSAEVEWWAETLEDFDCAVRIWVVDPDAPVVRYAVQIYEILSPGEQSEIDQRVRDEITAYYNEIKYRFKERI